MFIDRPIQILPITFYLLAQFSNRGVKGIDPLFLLPEVVLHRRYLIFYLPAILYLLEDLLLLCSGHLDLVVQVGDGLGVVDVDLLLFLDLHLVGFYQQLEVLDAGLLLEDELLSNGFHVD